MSGVNDELDGASGMSKIIPILVLSCTVIGFITLSYYAYNTGRQSIKDDDLLVIEADTTPIKEKPADPGGMKFPNQDKTVFETFASNKSQPKIEKVLPKPEEPIKNIEPLEEITKEEGDDNKIKPLEVVEIATNNVATKAETKKIEPIKIEEKKPVEQKPIEPKIVETKPVEKFVPKIETKDIAKVYIKDSSKSETTEEKPVTISEPKPEPKKEVRTGNAKIQLGAYGSEAEARDNWNKITRKLPSLADRVPAIIRADIAGKGTYYRLRLVDIEDKSAAKALCQTISAKGQACIVVGGE